MDTTNNFSVKGPEFSLGLVSGQRVLNRYRLDCILGQGGMGVVWRAHDEELDLKVALKFLPSLVVNDRASLSELKRETRRSLELTHPNIVRTYDFLQDSSLAGISMEYVESDTLRNRRIDQPAGVFEPAQLGDWTIQLASALDYAHHTAAIVHRDLKPANLLISGRNYLKVADFGISRSLVESVTQVTGGTSVSGTLVYMSPQQLEGNRAHALDDIYAVGATLYELCTSRPPFFSGDISRQVHSKIPPRMADRRVELGIAQGNLPENWETIVAACLAKDPAARPQSAGEIAVRLGLREAASTTTTAPIFVPPTVGAGGSGWGTTAGPAPSSPGWGTTVGPAPAHHGPGSVPMFHRKNRLPVVLAAAAVLVVAAGAVFLLTSHKENSSEKPADIAQSTAAEPRTTKSAEGTAASETVVAPDPAKLANARGGVFVETEPSDALVKVDDRPAEKTPIPLKDLTAGTHTLRIMLDGYVDYTMPIEVKAGQMTTLDKITLVRSVGWLKVTTTPPGAALVVKGPDGASVKGAQTTPWNSDKLPTGNYEIIATRQLPGWKSVVVKVTLAGDQSLPVPIDLTGGSVEITSDPPGATVVVDGKTVGTTPCTMLDVPPGDVQYKLSYNGYDSTAVDGKVESGKSLKRDVKLTKTAAKAPSHQTNSRTASRSSHHGDDDDDNNGRSGSSWKDAVIRNFGGGAPMPGPRFRHP